MTSSLPATPATRNSAKCLSEKIDPVLCAINTLMFGLLVHFGTIWTIENYISNNKTSNHQFPPNCTTYNAIPFILLLHEYWVYLQHTNVLANPHLQHLDRQYGIALLKNNQHWAIAGTLSSYWCRETVGMSLTLPYLQVIHQFTSMNSENKESLAFSNTQYMVLYSLVYHTIKSRGVRSDAIKRYSSSFGIMRIVIDRFYLDSLKEFAVSLGRLFLQGMDTFIHFCIVRDMMMLLSINSVMHSIHILFVIWVLHAALNQLFCCSTATVIVKCWDHLTAKPLKSNESTNLNEALTFQKLKQIDNTRKTIDYDRKASIIRCESSSSSGSSVSEMVELVDNDEKYIVRQLLHHERVPTYLRGRDGSASTGVDTAVRMETAITIVTTFFMIGLGKVPLESLAASHFLEVDRLIVDTKQIFNALLFSWLFWGVLYGIWSFFMKSRRSSLRYNASFTTCWRSIIYVLDMCVILAIKTMLLPGQTRAWFVCLTITVKSFMQTQRNSSPKLFRTLILVVEFLAKLSLLKMLLVSSADDGTIDLISSALTLFWLVWVITNPIPTPCEVKEEKRSDADAVFLGHPAELSDFWALWLLPYSLEERWKPPFWAILLWPLHYIFAVYSCKYQRRLFGDSASYICCDDVCYVQSRIQNWVIPHFGRDFVWNKRDVKKNIEAAARHAEKMGVKVLCLGALNKAESINGGGASLVKHLGPNRKLSVIHGNHLTAAAVVETIHQCFRDRNTKFFLTGASSKVGWAVAQALKTSGYDVLCHSTDKGRREHFEKNGFASATTLEEGAAFSNYWIVGKYDRHVAHEIPQNAAAVVFSVPHPLSSRKDVRIIEAGTLHIDMKQLDRPRQFTNKLKAHEIFACHAASAVAVHRLRKGQVTRIDEVGPVKVEHMNSWLADAKKLGFSVPLYEPVATIHSVYPNHLPQVVIVGAGPAGLCAAAGLSIRNIPFLVLDAETNTDMFGSWNILSRVGANVTTQKKYCNLTGYEMSNKDFAGDYVSPTQYQRYLRQYANRFSITRHIRRGVRAVSVEKTDDETTPWKIRIHDERNDGIEEEIVASHVIIATGKHRIACANTSDDIVSKLNAANIPLAHSSEMTTDNWKLAFQAASNGTLCIVGFGNSAADISSAILRACHRETGSTMIHIAARTVPPVFPQSMSFLRADTIGYILSWLPFFVQEYVLRLLWRFILNSDRCNSAFPSHLKRWNKMHGRIPVIDKGHISTGFMSGRLKGHGPIIDVNENGAIFSDTSHPILSNQRTKVEMVILATGYGQDCIVDREDRPNGLYKVGFGNDNFLPLHSMCKEVEVVVDEIANG